ncbi:ESPR-type extended signal peptide-containing protein [uncultured Veillonella sp.]|uniref:ESPR-type extended signal peptide-containing protein n=1 Tax=uncultured Veillonella sp. TaxID=159268 RepID=UPI0028056986|nr:ESPR-type extended signal peptide-containing protein [uncultured Veillonella sp.]
MNKIFKVVWSKSKECYVVVSEVAKNNGGKKKVLASVLAGLAMVGVAAQMGTPVQAGSNTNGNNINVWSNQRVDTPVAGGPGVTNTNTQNTAGDNSVTIGQQLTTGTGAVAVGRLSTALGDRAVAFGEEVHAKKEDTIAIGNKNNSNTGGGIAIGKGNLADSTNEGAATGEREKQNSQIAIGRDNKATHIDTTAIGREVTSSGTAAVGLGSRAEASGDYAIAIGGGSTSNKVKAADYAIAIGTQAQATGKRAIAQGGGSKATAERATALGYRAEATTEDGVALGSNSKATTVAGVDGYNPADSRTNTYAGLSGNAKTSTLAAVSVGDGSNATRQITGLAAGKEDTDAVNVAQLKNVNLKYAGNSGSGDVLLNNGTLNLKGEGLISTTADASGVTVKLTTGDTITNNNGKAVAPAPNGVATTDNVVQAINKAGWNANASANGGKLTGSATATKVVPGDTVTFSAGKNLTVEQTLGTNTQQYTYGLSSTLKDIESIQNGASKITLNNAGGTTISGGNLSVDGNKITNVAKGTDDTDAVNYSQIKDLRTEVKAGNGITVTPSKGTDGHDIYTVSANATGGTASTESVVKKAAAAGDTNIADVSVADGKNVKDPGAQYEVSVSKNAVKDAAREAVTVNNGGNTDNPITVTPTDDAANHTTTYAVTFDGDKAAKQIPLTYKANGSGDKTVKLDKGLDFTNGTNTTAEIGNDGVVKFNLKDNVALTNAGSLTVGDTKVNNDGLTISGGPSVTTGGIDAGSKKITNVEKGTANTDAVNVKQLKDTEKHIKPDTYAVANDGSVTLKYVDGNGAEQTETAKITGIAKKSKVIDGQNTTVEEGTDTTDNSVTYKVNVKGDLADISSITNGTGSGKISFEGDKVVKVGGDHPISFDGKGGYVTGLENKTWDLKNPTVVSGRAATEDQLKAVSDGFNNTVKLTGNTGVTGTQKLNQDNGLSFGVVGADNGKYITTTASGSNVVADLSTDAKNKLNSKVVVAGSGAATVATPTVTTNADGSTVTTYTVHVDPVAATAASTESVVKKAAATGDTNIADVSIADGKNVKDPGAQYEVSVSKNAVKDAAREAVTVNNGGNTDSPITVTPTEDAAKHNTSYAVTFDGAKAAKVIPLTYKANGTNNQTVTLEKGLNFTNGSNTTASVDAEGVVKYDLNKDVDLSNTGSLTVGGTTVNNDGITIKAPTPAAGATPTTDVKLTNTGLDNGGNKITNVKAGENDTDAVNVKQLKANRTEVKAGDNVVVTSDVDATDNHTVYTVNAVTPAVYTTPDGEKLTKDKDGKFHKVGETAEYTGDVITSFENPKAAAGQTTKDGGMIVNNIGSAIKNQTPTMPAGQTATYLDKLKAAADAGSNVKNAAVNVSDLHNTAEALKANELHIRPTASNRAGETVNKNAAGTADEVYKYDAATKSVTLKYNDGTGAGVTGTEAKIDLSDLANQITSGYTFKANATAKGGTVEGTATETAVENGGTVNFAAGKNLTVKQEIDAANKTHTYTYSLDKDLTNLDKVVVNGKDGIAGKDGVTIVGPQGATGATGIPGTNGIDGKVGITGKDGKDAVSIAGKDGVGTIGLTGPQGPAGTNGKSVDISTENGTKTLVKPEANNNDQSQRIVYVPKDANGNPLKDADNNDIKREVATMDDGLKFAGDDGQANANKVIAKQLNQQVDIIGGATGDLSDNNIGVNNDNGKLKVQLAKDVNLTPTGSLTTGDTKVNNDGITIKAPTPAAGATPTTDVKLTNTGLDNGGNKITNVKAGENDTDAVNVKQLKANRTEVKAGDNVVVTSDVDATDNHTVYTVNAVTPAVYTTPDGEKLTKDKDGKFHKVGETAEYTGDVITSFENPKAAAGQTTKDGGMIVNNIGSAIKNQTPTMPAGQTATYLDKLKAAADAGSNVKNAAVNVSDLHNTAEALKANELHIRPTASNRAGETVNKNAAGTADEVYKYDAATKSVTLKYNDGTGAGVTGTEAKIDLSDLANQITSGYTFKANATAKGGTVEGTATETAVENGGTVNFAAGKNLTVKQEIDAANKTHTYTYSLDKDLTNLDKVVVNGKDGIAGKDGVTIVGPQGATGATGIPGTNGIDGKVGITGKDGKDAVSIAGKDGVGTIGLTGPQGPAGTNGKSVDISTENGTKTLVKPEANNNDQSQRIVYVPKDANGNPLKDADNNDIKREVATMDDGLKFTGNNESTENKQKLGSLVKVQGEGTKEGADATGAKEIQTSDGTKFESAKDNIAVEADGANTLTVKLNKDLKGLDSVTTKEVKLGDANDNISIKKAGDRITYTTPGSTDTHKVATLDDEMHIKDTTYTVDGNKKVTMTYVDGNGNPVAGKTAVIDLSGLPVGETDTDMRIKEGTYTAQNGKVTLNTVDKGGNPVTGKDVVIDGINTNNYVAGDNVTLTPDTDAAGKPVVKINAALSTEKVVKKAGADNLATVSTASGNVAGDKGETYEVAVTKGDIENNAEISYKANGGTAQKTTLANGFNFTSDDNSVAITTGANGKVNFKVDTTGIQGKAFNLDVDKEGTGKVENAQTVATTKSVEKGTKFVAGNNLSIRHDAINGDANYDHQVTYALNSDLQGITSITKNGGATMNFGPNEVSITGGNLSMGNGTNNNKIVNVAPGTDKSDVATVGQLTKVTSNDNTVAINKTTDADGAPVYDLSVQGGGHDPRVDQLGEEIGRVGAQGAALAALKPIQYDPLEPTQIMAGYGNYRGNSAIAMGVAHYKNESTLMHAGVSWAGASRHMMANAGVTWKVGNRDSEAAVADRYRKGPISSAYAMQQEMASVKAQNAGLKTEVSDLKAENEQMKAQIAAMMAKLGM